MSISDNVGANTTEVFTLNTYGPSDVKIGSSATFFNTGKSVEHSGAKLDFHAINTGGSAIFRVHAGNVVVHDTAQILSFMQYGDKVDWRGSGFSKISIFGGEFDASRCRPTPGFTATFISLFRGCTYRDPYDALQIPVSFVGCTPSDVTLDLRQNLRLSVGAPPAPVVQ